VEAVLGADPLDPLVTLVDRSLVRRSGSAYLVPAPVRADAVRRLRAAGEEREVRDRHAAWCQTAAARASLAADGRPGVVSLDGLDPLVDELRTALHWATTGGSARVGFAVVRGLAHWWPERGLVREGRRWLDRLDERRLTTGEPVPDAELAAAHHLRALLAGADGQPVAGLADIRRAERLARRAGDPALLARVRAGRWVPLVGLGRLAEAERSCRDAIERARRAGVPGDALHAVYGLAELLWWRGALDEAATLLAAARPLEAVRPDGRAHRTVDMTLGLVALARDDLVGAHDHLVVALRARMTHGFHARATETLGALAVRCAVGGEPVVAARLFGAAQAARARLRVGAGAFGPYWTKQQAALRTALGDAAFDAAYAEGSASTVEEAAALALAVQHPDLAAGARFANADPPPEPPAGVDADPRAGSAAHAGTP
jgi:hypothetical protein